MKTLILKLKGICIAFIFSFMIYGIVIGQTIELNVVATNGGFVETPHLSLSWTTGELIINTLNDDSYILTQGFQQSLFGRIMNVRKRSISANDLEMERIEVSASVNFNMQFFPNPVNEELTVKFESEVEEALQILLYDLWGKLHQTHHVLPSQQSLRINMVDLTAGLYFLSLQNATSHLILSTSRVVKSRF